MSQPDPGTGNESIADVSEWNRFLLAVGVFLLLESVLIIAFGSSPYGDPDPKQKVADPDGMSQTAWFTLSLLGYFLLGLIARSWVVLMVAFLPMVIAFAVGVPSGVSGVGEPLPLFLYWGLGMVVFLPVCAIGVGVSQWVARRLRNDAEDEPDQVN